MRVIYLIVAHNEVESLDHLVESLKPLLSRFQGFQAYVIENGSTDGTAEALQKLSAENSWLQAISIPEKGMGHAFRHGMRVLEKLNLSKNDWILFTAADLPFGFSDLESFTQIQPLNPRCELFIGSKSHRASKIQRNLKRTLASWVFHSIRVLLLGMKTKDPQGTLFLHARHLSVVEKLRSPDYFFTTELVYYMEKTSPVIEMPVTLNADRRVSKVNILKDGIKVVRQIFELKVRDL